jgi:AAA domain
MPNTGQRFRKASPCPICHGYDEAPRGRGVRCFGFLSSDGEYAHCSREEHAGRLPQESNSQTYAHRLTGDCKCGTRHDPTSERSGGRTIVATYDYTDADGRLLYQAVRYVPKGFSQRRPHGKERWMWDMHGVRYVLYHLPEVLEAISHGKPVCVTEGEKDADALIAKGYVATTNIAGAGKWRPEYTEQLDGAERVVLFPHNDIPGRDHMGKVSEALRGAGIPVFMAQMAGLPDKGDISDWLKAHPAQEDLDQLMADARPVLTETDLGTRQFPTLESISYTLADLQHEELPTLTEVMPGILPEGFGIIAGPSGTGKSFFCLQLALVVCRGLKFLGQWETRKSDVLYLGTEDSKRRMKGRVGDLDDEDEGMRWPDNCTVVHQPQTLEGGLVAQIIEWLDRHPEARLILIDMFADVRGPRKQQGNWYEEDRQAGKQLSHLANDRHLCIMATMHTNRLRQSEDPFERVYGGDGVLGACDIKTVLLPTSTFNQHTWSLKGRDVPEQHYTLSFVEGLWVYEGVKMADASDERRAILHYFQTWPGAHRPDDVARALEKPANAINRLLIKMAKAGTLRKVGYGTYQLNRSSL